MMKWYLLFRVEKDFNNNNNSEKSYKLYTVLYYSNQMKEFGFVISKVPFVCSVWHPGELTYYLFFFIVSKFNKCKLPWFQMNSLRWEFKSLIATESRFIGIMRKKEHRVNVRVKLANNDWKIAYSYLCSFAKFNNHYKKFGIALLLKKQLTF